MKPYESFLLSTAKETQIFSPNSTYDEDRHINLKVVDGSIIPSVLADGNGPTIIKTAAYPGDDNPDPEDERCY
ncbi:MAG: hypothetical protein KAR42_04695 [candidate division Zixibacteria bacterium]|nr:hypothetical protein [candidate division Zixibacteria bacterium]